MDKVLIWGNINKKRLRGVLIRLLKIFTSQNIAVNLNSELLHYADADSQIAAACEGMKPDNMDLSSVDLAIILGGDGTVIHAARELLQWQIPILGINLGHLGFLTELNPTEVEKVMPEIIAGNYSIEERMMLEAKYDGKSLIAMNEFVISKGNSPRFVRLNIVVNDKAVAEIYADGLVVSTPTGSTAYSMSLGGSILTPDLDGILLTAMAPHMLTFRPFVVSGGDTISIHYEILSEDGTLYLSADGQDTRLLGKEGSVVIGKAEKRTKLVSYHKRSFYSLLEEKFGWGKVPGVMKYGVNNTRKFQSENDGGSNGS